MTEVNLIFPHQLFENHPAVGNGHVNFLIEEYLFFRQYQFHKHKILFHRTSMKAYQEKLRSAGNEVHYIDAHDECADIRQLIVHLHQQGVKEIHFVDPTDDWLSRRISHGSTAHGIKQHRYQSPLFINGIEELDYFKSGKKKLFQTAFYKQQRKLHRILLDGKGEPQGGKWTYDVQNRRKFPSHSEPPKVTYPKKTQHFIDAKKYVEQHFGENPGDIPDSPVFPMDRDTSVKWMDQFLEARFREYGTYQDAIVSGALVLHHSVMSPLINTGLVTPGEFIERILEYSSQHEIPINSTEGLVRQILGWREFVRGVYQNYGPMERTKNFWGFTRKIPSSFYTGETGITPVDQVIRKVLKYAYCHHIERLMILGNFMLLCEFDPDEVYRWFMELFIDAYDWVMVPNIYGMSQFADGGLFATKPYISGSNYLRKMSDFERGNWENLGCFVLAFSECKQRFLFTKSQVKDVTYKFR